MVEQPPILDAEDFRRAARLQREGRLRERHLSRVEALAALHRARDALHEESERSEAAARDADRLERMAEHLIDWGALLQRDLERLEIACEQVLYRGPLLTRRRPAIEPGALALGLAESLCDNLLSAHAGAVLCAAVRLGAT